MVRALCRLDQETSRGIFRFLALAVLGAVLVAKAWGRCQAEQGLPGLAWAGLGLALAWAGPLVARRCERACGLAGWLACCRTWLCMQITLRTSTYIACDSLPFIPTTDVGFPLLLAPSSAAPSPLPGPTPDLLQALTLPMTLPKTLPLSPSPCRPFPRPLAASFPRCSDTLDAQVRSFAQLRRTMTPEVAA